MFLVIATSSACQKTESTLSVQIEPVYKGQPIDCEAGININGQTWQIDQFSMFISDPTLTAQNTIDNRKGQTVQLVGGDCNQLTNWSIDAKQVSEQINYLSFAVGVPFELNHQNPLTQAAPLNDSSMFWSWQMGHKFLRMDMTSNEDRWFFHLGSTGCDSAAPVRGPVKPCKHPNVVNIKVPFQPGHVLYLHVDELLKDIEPNQKNVCMSNQQTKSCQLLFKNLSLEGSGPKGTTQRLFSTTNTSTGH